MLKQCVNLSNMILLEYSWQRSVTISALSITFSITPCRSSFRCVASYCTIYSVDCFFPVCNNGCSQQGAIHFSLPLPPAWSLFQNQCYFWVGGPVTQMVVLSQEKACQSCCLTIYHAAGEIVPLSCLI